MQTRAELDLLVPLLADPVTHEPVSHVPVVDNVPRMRVSDGELARKLGRRAVDSWKQVQAAGEQAYLGEGAYGNLSHDQWAPALEAGELFARYRPGPLVLDIGCGLLPEPAYIRRMRERSGDDAPHFVGVDPLTGDKKRTFAFVESYGDFLPFLDGTFDAVMLVSTLDHMISPERTMEEAFRVVRPGGLLLFEGTARKIDRMFLRWRALRLFGPAHYNQYHDQAFTRRSLARLVSRVGFVNSHMTFTTDEAEPLECFIVAEKPAARC